MYEYTIMIVQPKCGYLEVADIEEQKWGIYQRGVRVTGRLGLVALK